MCPIVQNHGMICINCLIQLDTVNKFYEQCLRSKDIFTNYVTLSNVINEAGNEVKFYVSLLKYEEKQYLENFVTFANNCHVNKDLFAVMENAESANSETSETEAGIVDGFTGKITLMCIIVNFSINKN